ncbi:MAG: 16S rRNA (cytidine(1402)-2'-O)-methyltransferase [Coraliomargaritaceae bacterium]
MSKNATFGTLTLVAVPIGNLGDITERSRQLLLDATCVACEDTRVTGKLLAILGAEKRAELISFREENEIYLAEKIADRLSEGEDILLVSDAGTPAISDPGFRLVRECRRRGLPVTSAPGATAVATALSLSGLPSDGFLFAGFLPPKKSARCRFLESHKDFNYTIVLYESCHRISKFLDEIVETLGAQRCISVCRELTKLHETIHTGPSELVRDTVARGSQKGEFVVLIAKNGFTL